MFGSNLGLYQEHLPDKESKRCSDLNVVSSTPVARSGMEVGSAKSWTGVSQNTHTLEKKLDVCWKECGLNVRKLTFKKKCMGPSTMA